MADGIVFYADLRLPSEPNSARLPHPSRGSGVSRRSHWFWIALCIGWTGNIILVITVTVLGISGTVYPQGSCHKEENVTAMNVPKHEAGNLTNSQLECSKKIAHLKSSLCETPSGFTGCKEMVGAGYTHTKGSECKLCPMKWMSEKGKCYWISDQKKTWSEARDNCFRRGAQMVVIQDLEELEFIQKSIQGEYSLWIGLNFVFQTKNWTWIDGSLLDYTMVQLPLSAAENTCGTMVKDKGITSDMCSDEFEWMCEKKAVVF